MRGKGCAQGYRGSWSAASSIQHSDAQEVRWTLFPLASPCRPLPLASSLFSFQQAAQGTWRHLVHVFVE